MSVRHTDRLDWNHPTAWDWSGAYVPLLGVLCVVAAAVLAVVTSGA